MYRNPRDCTGTDTCMTWARDPRDKKIDNFRLAHFRSIIEIEFLMGLK